MFCYRQFSKMTNGLVLAIAVAACSAASTAQDRLPPTLDKNGESWAVGIAQSLLNEAGVGNKRLKIDGLWGKQTAAAVKSFRAKKGLPAREDIDQEMWQELFGDQRRYVVIFEHQDGVKDNKNTPVREDLYGSTVTLVSYDRHGAKTVGMYRGAILPQDTSKDASPPQGRIADGVYEIQLGFHRRSKAGNAVAVKADDLKVKFGTDADRHVRPCLVVARDGYVKVNSRNSRKTRANLLHIHDGPEKSRSSHGCPTIVQPDYRRFITHFLQAYTSLDDWQSKSTSYVGQSIGVLVVRTK